MQINNWFKVIQPTKDKTKKITEGTLKEGEIHPAASYALAYIKAHGFKYRASFAICSRKDNRLAEVCAETFRRIENNEPVSDRYLLGLAWSILRLEMRSLFK